MVDKTESWAGEACACGETTENLILSTGTPPHPRPRTSWGIATKSGEIVQYSAGFEAIFSPRIEQHVVTLIAAMSSRNETRRTLSGDILSIQLIRLLGSVEERFLIICEVDSDAEQKFADLTRRQFEIAEYAAAGATTKEIANALNISPLTVKTHLRTIYERLEVANRVELAEAIRPQRL